MLLISPRAQCMCCGVLSHLLCVWRGVLPVHACSLQFCCRECGQWRRAEQKHGSKCCMFNKLQHKAEADLSGEEANEMRRCQQHMKTKNSNASTIN